MKKLAIAIVLLTLLASMSSCAVDHKCPAYGSANDIESLKTV